MAASDILVERCVPPTGVEAQRSRARGRALGGESVSSRTRVGAQFSPCSLCKEERAPGRALSTHRLLRVTADGGVGGGGPEAREGSRGLAHCEV